MHWKIIAVLVASLSSATVLWGAEAAPEFAAPRISVPAGYVVEVAAAPPLVEHPMMAGFDDRGRLFIAESAGLNLRRDDLEQQLPNFIRMLEDTDGDGRFDKSTIFADKLTLPMGALWHDGALFVAAPPSIWRFEDTDDDGVADRRQQLVDSFGYSGNAASIHGPFLGPDGRLYWCDGRHGHEFRDAEGRIVSQGKAARIFSCRSDGSDRRVWCGGGMDNPVEVDFTLEGEMLGTVNLFYRERGDCLVHWMHGGVYPRHDQEAVVAEFRRTGDLLPPVYDLGHVAVSGTTRYRGTQLGRELQDNFFITEFNTHKLVRAEIERDGSTYRATLHPFLEAHSDDFHPTDVLEDADGSLLLVDTGGWFRIGCPTSQIAKPNILGAIYRIRREDASAPDDPRGGKIAWNEATPQQLVGLLDDQRWAVRDRAIAELAKRGDAAVAPLETLLSRGERPARCAAIWSLTRIDTEAARAAIRSALSADDASVRQAAARSVTSSGDPASRTLLQQLVVADESPAVRREAATALGRIGDAAAASALLKALSVENDRMLEHAILYALIEIGSATETAAGLADADPRVRRGALIALDQMPQGNLTRQQVTPLLDTDDMPLQQTALDVISRRPGWAEETVALLQELLERPQLDAARQAMLRGALVGLRSNPEIQRLVTEALGRSSTPVATTRLLLEVIARGEPDSVPADWRDRVRQILQSGDLQVVEPAIHAAAALGGEAYRKPLLAIAGDEKFSVDLRVAALDAASVGKQPLAPANFHLLAQQIDDRAPPMRRLAAARALGRAALTREQLEALPTVIARAGPLELTPLLGAYERAQSLPDEQTLVAALAKSPGLASLTAGQLQTLVKRSSDSQRAGWDGLLEQLRARDAEQAAQLDELQALLPAGDAERGRAVFFGAKASCFACHRVGEQGGRIGPDLTTIGTRRNQRDLLEAILYPSASLARGFESYALTSSDGRVYSGLITRESADALHLRTTDQREVRLPRDAVEEMLPSAVSIMPAGLQNSLSERELSDLVAYLLTRR